MERSIANATASKQKRTGLEARAAAAREGSGFANLLQIAWRP